MTMSDAERARNYRARNGATTRTQLIPCGTPGSLAPYRRHIRANQKPCVLCAAEWAAYHTNRNRQQREQKDLNS